MLTYWIVIVAFFAILFGIGIVSSRRIHDMSDYYVGGKKLGFWVVAFSARATGELAWLLLGLTGMGAAVGLSALWVVAGEVIGVAVAWFLMAERFKKRTDEYNSITVPDYLVSHFKDHAKLLRLISAGALAVFVTIYVSAQIDATGQAFESFLGWNTYFSDWGKNAGYYIGALVGFGIVVIYTFSGGFVAVAWSDLFQGIMMLLGLVTLPFVAFFFLSGDTGLLASLSAIDPKLTSMWGKHGPTVAGVAAIIGFLAIGLGFMGSPQMFVRFMSIKDKTELNKGKAVAIAFTILTDVGAVLIGLMGRVLLAPEADFESVLGKNAQDVLPLLVKHVFPSVIVALYIAAVLSAIMSTVDSLLVVASSAVTRDFYQQSFHHDLPDEKMTRLSRIVTLSLALLALAIALVVAFLSPERSIFWFVIFGWSGIAATFCPMIILSLFWRGYNAVGAITSMIVGFLSVPFFKFAATKLPVVGGFFGHIEELFPSFILAGLAGFIASKISANKQEVAA